MKFAFAALAAISLAATASAASAENPFARDQTVLDLNGIDLATAGGQQRLAIRMDEAARTVCGDRVASLSLDTNARANACRTAVVADIRSQIETRQAAVLNKNVQVASAF